MAEHEPRRFPLPAFAVTVLGTAAGMIEGAYALQDAHGLNPSRVATDTKELVLTGAITAVAATVLIKEHINSRRRQ